MVNISKQERIDETGFSNIKIIQNPKEFCYGIDAVLLSAFVAGETGTKPIKCKRMMDLGTGTGIIPFIVSHKTDFEYILGVEKQKTSWERAQKGLELNRINNIEFINKDIIDIKEGELGMFDAITCNPPYKKRGSGIRNDSEAKYIARHETSAELGDFIRVAGDNLVFKGHFFMVHRPSRLSDIIYDMKNNEIEPLDLQFVAPRFGEKPNILLIHGVKGGKNELKVLNELYVYEGDSYSEEILNIYERLD